MLIKRWNVNVVSVIVRKDLLWELMDQIRLPKMQGICNFVFVNTLFQ